MKLRNVCLVALCILLVMFTLTACDSIELPVIGEVELPQIGGVQMPKLKGVDESTAKSVLVDKGLIPALEYEYSDTVAEGSVIRTDPEADTKLKKNATVTLYVSKGPELKIPDLFGLDEETAKSFLVGNSLIPSVEYVYDDYVQEGFVVDTDPAVGTTVEKNQRVTVYVSKGPEVIMAVDSVITWWNVGYGEDSWAFYTPYIRDNVLYIECHKVVFGANVVWQDDYNKGKIIGEATISDTYEKVIPISAVYTKQSWTVNEAQSFTLEIPLNDLDVKRPTTIDAVLFATVNGVRKNIEISFSITW